MTHKKVRLQLAFVSSCSVSPFCTKAWRAAFSSFKLASSIGYKIVPVNYYRQNYATFTKNPVLFSCVTPRNVNEFKQKFQQIYRREC